MVVKIMDIKHKKYHIYNKYGVVNFKNIIN